MQSSESAVFGKLKRTGHLVIMPGGRVRVSYDKGLLVVSDGRLLIQYDAATRTAQRASLAACQREMPLLGVLVAPATLERTYRVLVLPDGRVELVPKVGGTPDVILEGKGAFLWRVSWTDGTGAAQTLELTHPRMPSSASPALFRFQAPAGTRWAGKP